MYLPELENYLSEMGEPRFRAKQIFHWLQSGVTDFDEMTDISKALRERLKADAYIASAETERRYASRLDETVKYVFRLFDGELIETVLMKYEHGYTVCISTQVGCRMGCKFCASGINGLTRSLTASEMLAQITAVQRDNNIRVSNIVMMGMGEPLLNLNNVVPAMEIMLDDFGFGLSKRRVTLSTSGVVPALDKLGDMIDVALAISLHAPNDEIRDEIVPINKKYNIETFLAAVRRYLEKSNANQGRVTIEYVMLDHVNDGTEHAHQLAELLKDTPCKINLIPWNPFPGAPYGRSSNSRIDRFSKVLMSYGFTTIVRKTRGDDIDAACGQLAGDVIDRTKRTLRKRMQGEAIDIKAV